MSITWKDSLLYKLEESEDKIEILYESMIDKENNLDWNVEDIVDQIDEINNIIDMLNEKINDVQNQIDIKQISSNRTKKERIEDYEIRKKITNDIFPYVFALNNYYRNTYDN